MQACALRSAVDEGSRLGCITKRNSSPCVNLARAEIHVLRIVARGIVLGWIGGLAGSLSSPSINICFYWEISVKWRRRRDSNPRGGFPPAPLAGVCLRPLGHVSAARSSRAEAGKTRANRMEGAFHAKFAAAGRERRRVPCRTGQGGDASVAPVGQIRPARTVGARRRAASKTGAGRRGRSAPPAGRRGPGKDAEQGGASARRPARPRRPAPRPSVLRLGGQKDDA